MGSVPTLKHMVLLRGSCVTLSKRCWVEGRRHKVLQRGSWALNLRRQVRDWTHCHLESSLLHLGLLLESPRGVVPKMKVLNFTNKQIKLGI